MKKIIILLALLYTIFTCQTETSVVSRFQGKDKNFNLARQFYVEKNYEKTIAYLKKSPLNNDIKLYLMAKSYFYNKQFKEAKNYFEKISEESILKPYSDIYIAETYLNLSETNQAKKILLKTSQLSDYKIVQAKSYYLLGKIVQNENHDTAIEYYKKFINLYNNFRYHWSIKKYFLGKNVIDYAYKNLIYLLKEKKYYDKLFYYITTFLPNCKEKNIKTYILSEIKPMVENKIIFQQNIKTLYIISREYYYVGWEDIAEIIFKRIILDKQDDSEHYKLKSYYFLALISRKYPEKAIEYMHNGVIIYNSSPESLYYFAKVYIYLGKFDDAIKILNHIINSKNQKYAVLSYMTLIDLYQKIENDDMETKTIKQFFQNYPSNKYACEYLYKKSLKYYVNNNSEQCKEILYLLKKGRYFKSKAYFFLGEIYFNQKEYDKSYYYLKSYIKNFPHNYFTLEAMNMLKKMPQYKKFKKIIAYEKQKLISSINKEGGQYLSVGKNINEYTYDKDFKIASLLLKNGLTMEGMIHLENFEMKFKKEKLDMYKFLLNWFTKNNFPYRSLSYRLRLLYQSKIKNKLLYLPEKYITYLFPKYYTHFIDKLIDKYNIDSSLVYSLILAESLFNIEAISPANAEGLFQIIPSTTKLIIKKGKIDMKGWTVYNIKKNAEIGLWYLYHLNKKFKNDYILSLSSYNAGEGNVNKWRKKYNYNSKNRLAFIELIPYSETKEYVKKILFSYYFYKEKID